MSHSKLYKVGLPKRISICGMGAVVNTYLGFMAGIWTGADHVVTSVANGEAYDGPIIPFLQSMPGMCSLYG